MFSINNDAINQVSCGGNNPKCYLYYEYLGGERFRTELGCAEEEKNGESRHCNPNNFSKLCPTPNNRGKISIDSMKNGELSCGYCCDTTLCNIFNNGKLSTLLSGINDVYKRGYRDIDIEEEAISRVIAFSAKLSENDSVLDRIMATIAFNAMLMGM